MPERKSQLFFVTSVMKLLFGIWNLKKYWLPNNNQ